MYVFDEKNDIVKMESPEEIIYHFWRIRNEYYEKRQSFLCDKLRNELDTYTNKIRFVNDIMEDNIKVFRQKLSFIHEQLQKCDYKQINSSYNYLTDMKIHTFTEDTISELTRKRDRINSEYTKIMNMKLRDFWLEAFD